MRGRGEVPDGSGSDIILLLQYAVNDGISKFDRLDPPSRVDKKLWPFRILKFSNSYTISRYSGFRAHISKLFFKKPSKNRKSGRNGKNTLFGSNNAFRMQGG